ncbi:MAG: methylmalonyl-CoA epimerase [Planctomycetota bacterium]
MLDKLNHIGIAVTDIESAARLYRDVLGLEVIGEEVVEDQKVRTLKLKVGEVTIELLEPTAADSPISKFLEKRGGGIHHLAYDVEDLEATLAKLKDAGLQLIDEEPRIGAGGHRIAFVHPKATAGVLTELIEE